jgi:hypothetical protein
MKRERVPLPLPTYNIVTRVGAAETRFRSISSYEWDPM